MPLLVLTVPLLMIVFVVVIFAGLSGILMLAVVATLPAFILLHYVLWGRLLSRRPPGGFEDEADD